ncbi:MAG: hypothetical protein HY438_02765 [DPANN group archaeon]|nr:hypothetical protein [DPANN group archaeon]
MTSPDDLIGLTYETAWIKSGGAAAEIVEDGLETKLKSIVAQLGFDPHKKVRNIDDARLLFGLAGAYEPNVAFSDHDGNKFEANLFLDRPEKPGFFERLKQKHPVGYDLARKLLVVGAVVFTVGLAGCLGSAPAKKPEDIKGGGPQIADLRLHYSSIYDYAFNGSAYESKEGKNSLHIELLPANFSEVSGVTADLYTPGEKTGHVALQLTTEPQLIVTLIGDEVYSADLRNYYNKESKLKINLNGKGGTTEVITSLSSPKFIEQISIYGTGTHPDHPEDKSKVYVGLDFRLPDVINNHTRVDADQNFNISLSAHILKGGMEVKTANAQSTLQTRSIDAAGRSSIYLLIDKTEIGGGNNVYTFESDILITDKTGSQSSGSVSFSFVPNRMYDSSKRQPGE